MLTEEQVAEWQALCDAEAKFVAATRTALPALLTDRAELMAEVQRLRATLAAKEESQRANEDEMGAECERMRAVVKAARWVTPYIPEIGEETYCHPMHHGYHDGQFHTVYITEREQTQFGEWANHFVDALAALDEEVGE